MDHLLEKRPVAMGETHRKRHGDRAIWQCGKQRNGGLPWEMTMILSLDGRCRMRWLYVMRALQDAMCVAGHDGCRRKYGAMAIAAQGKA